MGCPGWCWRPWIPWRNSVNNWMQHTVVWSGWRGGVGSQVGLDDPGGLLQPKLLCDSALPSLLLAVVTPHPPRFCSPSLPFWRCTGKVYIPCAVCSRRVSIHCQLEPSTLSADTQGFVAPFFTCLHLHHLPLIEALHNRMPWYYKTSVNSEVFLWECIVKWVALHCVGHIIWHSLEETIICSIMSIIFSSSVYGTFLVRAQGCVSW